MTRHSTLVDTDTLAQHLADADWVVVDCRHDLAAPDAGRNDYRRSHVPGARFLHIDADLSGPMTGRNGRHPLPDPAVLADKLGAAGITSGKQVVAYDAHGGMFAARLWWLLRWLGHDDVAVLDGGYTKWLREGRPQTDELPPPATTRFDGRPRPIAVDVAAVDVAYVLASLRDPRMTLVDARAPDRYRGENETLDPVGGHIPGARNRFFKDNLDAAGTFKPPAQLHAEWQAVLGNATAGSVVHQCGSGVTACHNALAMEIAGLPGSRLYGGSWSEWCADPSRPIATGEQP